MKSSLGVRQAIIRQKDDPPRQCFSKQVNLESRYGIWLIPVLSASAVITLRSVNNDLLISIHSFYILPLELVYAILSDPARSTSYSLALTTFFGNSGSIRSTFTQNNVWDRDDALFIRCDAITLFYRP